MKIKNIFLSLSLIVLLGASALAQTGNDVSVKLINKDGKVVATSNLDSKGNFNLPDVPVGEYTMKVVVNDFHFIKMTAVDGDKGTNGQNSTGKYGIKEQGVKKSEEVAIGEDSARVKGSVTQKMQAVDRVAKIDSFTWKLSSITGVSANDFWVKGPSWVNDNSASARTKSGLDAASKDAAKMSIKTANPSEVQLESWSWGASNTLTYTTKDEAKLKEGVEVQISVKEKKNLIGHVTIVK
jgi:hypothetical protein